jgi:hypothetical protein
VKCECVDGADCGSQGRDSSIIVVAGRMGGLGKSLRQTHAYHPCFMSCCRVRGRLARIVVWPLHVMEPAAPSALRKGKRCQVARQSLRWCLSCCRVRPRLAPTIQWAGRPAACSIGHIAAPPSSETKPSMEGSANGFLQIILYGRSWGLSRGYCERGRQIDNFWQSRGQPGAGY